MTRGLKKEFLAEFKVREKESCEGLVASATGVHREPVSALHLSVCRGPHRPRSIASPLRTVPEVGQGPGTAAARASDGHAVSSCSLALGHLLPGTPLPPAPGLAVGGKSSWVRKHLMSRRGDGGQSFKHSSSLSNKWKTAQHETWGGECLFPMLLRPELLQLHP